MIWEIKMPVQVSVYVYAYVCLFVDDERMIEWFGGGEDGCQWALRKLVVISLVLIFFSRFPRGVTEAIKLLGSSFGTCKNLLAQLERGLSKVIVL